VAEDQQGLEGMTAQEILATPDLIAVGIAGDEVRRRIHGAVTTFVRVLEVHVDAPQQSLPHGAQPGEVRIIGVPSSLETAVAAVRAVVSIVEGVPVTGFSVADLAALGPLADVVRTLKDAGLVAIAHLPLDLVADAAGAARRVGEGGLTINAIAVHALDDQARLSICERARALQHQTGGFTAFAPLPRSMSIAKPTTGYDDVKMVALARVVCENIPSIQVDWQLYGPKMAQVALTVGADDVDNVSAVDPGVLGTRRSPLEEIKRNIVSAALEPVERDGLFRHRQERQA
jgi:aminodeoxyfutalosine synthase